MHALNELEFIPGANVILANVWYKDFIIAIEPESGLVYGYCNTIFIQKQKTSLWTISIRGLRALCPARAMWCALLGDHAYQVRVGD